MSLLPSRKIHFSLCLLSLDKHAFICTRHSFIYVRTKCANLNSDSNSLLHFVVIDAFCNKLMSHF